MSFAACSWPNNTTVQRPTAVIAELRSTIVLQIPLYLDITTTERCSTRTRSDANEMVYTLYSKDMSLTTSIGVVSESGSSTALNQNSVLVDEYLEVFTIADGYGESNAGKIASDLACTMMVEGLERKLNLINSNVSDRTQQIHLAIRDCYRAIDTRIRCEQSQQMQKQAMRASSLVALIDADPNANGLDSPFRVHFAGVGNCRSLVLRSQRPLRQLNTTIRSAGRQHSRLADIENQQLGGRFAGEPEMMSQSLQNEDRILLMTGGGTSHISDDDIAQQIANVTEAGHAAYQIVDEVLRQGSQEDVTCVVVDVSIDA